MAFNKSWNYLKSDWSSTDSLYGNADEDEKRKRPTIDNNYQTTIPQFDPKIDETTGWKGVEPVTAIRVQSNHRKAGQAVPQDGSNKNFEGGDPRLPQRIPEIPHDDDPVWDDPDSRWSKDPKSGSRYYMSGKYEDGKYNPRSKKHFADLKNAKAGTWAAKNTVGDIRNLFTHNNHEKLVYIRGNLDKYGKVHRRDSDEAQEDLAEAFIEHDKDIPRESLVEVPLRDHYIHQTKEMGTPDLGPNRRSSDRRPKGRVSRWSDKPLPWGESREPTKKIEDMDDDEFQEFQESLYDKTPEEIHELTKGSPMDIAFRLLKAQQTLPSYDPESVEELLHPDKRTVVISSKPNWVNEENPMSEEKQSDLHDNLLAELGALKNKKDMKIISARGKSVEWGDEHSIALSNVPDHHFDNIMGLASKYEQDSVLHSPKGTSSGELLKPSGEVDFPLGEGGFVDDAENMTEFNTGQRFAYGKPMDIAFQLLKDSNDKLQEMSNDKLGFFAAPGYLSNAKDKAKQIWERGLTTQQVDAAMHEMKLRQMETEGNMPQVFNSPKSHLDDGTPNLEYETMRDVVDFYDPQLLDGNVSSRDHEGAEAPPRVPQSQPSEDDNFDENEFDYEDRLMDVRFEMPGKFYGQTEPRETYEHLKETAPPEDAEKYLNRYRKFVMDSHINPEWRKEKLREYFAATLPNLPPYNPTPSEGEGATPKHTKDFPEGEDILDEKPFWSSTELGQPDATGFQHEWQNNNKSEPMEIALQLLKENISLPSDIPDDYGSTFRSVDNNITSGGEYMSDEELQRIFNKYKKLHDIDDEIHPHEYYNLLENIDIEQQARAENEFLRVNPNPDTGFTRSEPMDIALQLLKERKSPAAFAHKLEYDKQYQKDPKRVKYREQLNTERRKRGIYGKGGKDVSHTQGGKLTLESAHANRARHFKSKGTLRRVKVKK